MNPLAQYVHTSIKSCTSCLLHETCISPVPTDATKPNLPVLIVGEAPGLNEDEQGKPFVGRAGMLLRNTIHKISTKSYATMNVVCCRPPENRTPRLNEVRACRQNFNTQFELVDPKVIILAGSTALHAFRPDMLVTKVHGRPMIIRDRWAVPIYHPSYVLRDMSSLYVTFQEDLRLAFSLVRKRMTANVFSDTCAKCEREVDYYDADMVAWCKKHWVNDMVTSKMQFEQMQIL